MSHALSEAHAKLRRALSGAITEGIHQARLAALRLLDAEEQERDVVRLLTRLSTAIERLRRRERWCSGGRERGGGPPMIASTSMKVSVTRGSARPARWAVSL